MVIKTPPEEWKSGNKGSILIIQGFWDTWSGLFTIGDFLNKIGFKIFVVKKLGFNIQPLAESVEIVRDYIVKSNLDKFIIVAHSKGGLISKMLLNDSSINDKVDKVITIATPHEGSVLGYSRILNTYEFLPNSKLIKELNKNRYLNKKIINIFPCVDNVVVPNKSLVLKGSTNMCLNIGGHNNILKSKLTLDALCNMLLKGL